MSNVRVGDWQFSTWVGSPKKAPTSLKNTLFSQHFTHVFMTCGGLFWGANPSGKLALATYLNCLCTMNGFDAGFLISLWFGSFNKSNVLLYPEHTTIQPSIYWSITVHYEIPISQPILVSGISQHFCHTSHVRLSLKGRDVGQFQSGDTSIETYGCPAILGMQPPLQEAVSPVLFGGQIPMYQVISSTCFVNGFSMFVYNWPLTHMLPVYVYIYIQYTYITCA